MFRIRTLSIGLCFYLISAGNVSVAQQGTVDFQPPVETFTQGPGAGDRIAAGDMDRDCDLDLFNLRDTNATSENPSLTYLTADGTGGFSGITGLDAGQILSGLDLADFNQDGIPDLVTSEKFDRQVGPFGICGSVDPMIPVHLGNGMGGFTFAGCHQPKDHPADVVAGDFYRDGWPDLLVINAVNSSSGATSREALLYIGRGDGTFQNPQWVFDRRGDDVTAADFNSDGFLDVAVAARSTTYVYLGSASGQFTQAGGGIGGQSMRVVAGDLNGDGASDIVTVGSTEQSSIDDVVSVALNRNDGTGTFLSAVTYTTGLHPVAVITADLDQNGRDDVVVANHFTDDVSVFLSNPDGSLSSEQRFPANRNPNAVLAGDFNGDGFPDIAVANRNVALDGSLDDGSISVLIQAVTAPLEVVTPPPPDGEVGTPYHACSRARGGQPEYQWSVVAGTLPPGLLLDPMTGRYHGIPVVAGMSDFTCQVEDGATAIATRFLSIRVNEAPGPPPSVASEPNVGMAPMIVTAYDPASGMVTMQYDPACRSIDTAVHSGPLEEVRFYGYDSTTCNLGVSGTAQFPAGSGNRFWVVTGRDPFHDGSMGQASSGAERPGPPSFNACFMHSEIGALCP